MLQAKWRMLLSNTVEVENDVTADMLGKYYKPNMPKSKWNQSYQNDRKRVVDCATTFTWLFYGKREKKKMNGCFVQMLIQRPGDISATKMKLTCMSLTCVTAKK